MLTYDEYVHRWTLSRYRSRVKNIATLLKSDGCSHVTQAYQMGCLEHDIHYRTGKDVYRKPVTRAEADTYLRWYVQMESPLGALSPMAWIRWVGVRLFGSRSYKGGSPW